MSSERTTCWRRGRWLILWAVSCVALIVWFPARPTYRIRGTGALHFHEFVDSQTAVFWKSRATPNLLGPITLLFVDVVTGGAQSRTFAPPNAITGGPQDAKVAGGSPAGEFLGYRLAGPYLVLKTAPSEDRVRLTVWRSRTGELILDREFEGSNADVTGDLVWVHPPPTDADRKVMALYSIATGKPLSSKLPAWASPRLASVDGRFWLEERYRRGDRDVEVWSVETGSKVCTVEAQQFAISPDSKWLATVVCREVEKDRCVRTWRISELATGAIVAEREEPRPRRGYVSLMPGEFGFPAESDCVAFFGYADGNPGNRACPRPYDAVDVWFWRTNDLRQVLAHRPVSNDVSVLPRRSDPWFRNSTSRKVVESRAPSRFVVDGDVIVDVVTWGDAGVLPTGTPGAIALAPPWGVIRSQPGPIARRLAAISDRWAAEVAQPRLCDLSTGTIVAWLGRGRSIFEFSPDGRSLVTHDNESIEIWKLPVGRPTLEPFLWSLVFPALAGIFTWRRRRSRRFDAELAGMDDRAESAESPVLAVRRSAAGSTRENDPFLDLVARLEDPADPGAAPPHPPAKATGEPAGEAFP